MLAEELKVYTDNLFVVLSVLDLPIGVYLVTEQHGEERITECNPAFARIFHYPSAKDVQNVPVADMYRSEIEYKFFRNKLVDLPPGTELLHGHKEVLIAYDQTAIPVEVHCKINRDNNGKIINRIGVIFDITETEILLADIGSVLHLLGIATAGLKTRLEACQEALTPFQYSDPFGALENVPTSEDAAIRMEQPVGALKRALWKLLEQVEQTDHVATALPVDICQQLKNRMLFLENYKEHIGAVQLYPSALRQAAREITNFSRAIPPKVLPKDIIRNIIEKADELERIGCLFELHYASGRIIEMGYEVETLRELALVGLRQKEKKEWITVSQLITEAHNALVDYALSRNVDVDDKTQNYSGQTYVYVNRREIVRALRNLLHNAIKYSWHKVVRHPWVTIRTQTQQSNVVIEIENHGVAISREEIENGSIYKLGYRGLKSNDRQRPGTGMGLYDSRRIARMHGGDLVLDSIPTRGGDPEDLSRPFVTTARFTIPVGEGTPNVQCTLD